MEKREKYRQKINFSFFRKKKGRRKGEKCSKIRPNDPMGRVLECSRYYSLNLSAAAQICAGSRVPGTSRFLPPQGPAHLQSPETLIQTEVAVDTVGTPTSGAPAQAQAPAPIPVPPSLTV